MLTVHTLCLEQQIIKGAGKDLQSVFYSPDISAHKYVLKFQDLVMTQSKRHKTIVK